MKIKKLIHKIAATLCVPGILVYAVSASSSQKPISMTAQEIEKSEKYLEKAQEASYKLALERQKVRENQIKLAQMISKMTPESISKKYNINYSKAVQMVKDAKVIVEHREKLKQSDNKGNLIVFGIEIGKTTENEIRKNFNVIDEYQWEPPKGYKKLILDPNQFSVLNIITHKVAVYIKNETVESLEIELKKNLFDECSSTLIDQYRLINREITPYNFKEVYSFGDSIIELIELFMDAREFLAPIEIRVQPYTLLIYSTKRHYEIREKSDLERKS